MIWWTRAVIPSLLTIFRLSSFSTLQQQRHITFVVRKLIPHFGPTPSELTAEAQGSQSSVSSYKPTIRTPIELIWVLGGGNSPMSARFDMELISSLKSGHPYNPEAAWNVFLAIFQEQPSFDPSWAEICYNTLVYHDWRTVKDGERMIQFFVGTASSLVIVYLDAIKSRSAGGEFAETEVIGKLYFYPPLRARETNTEPLDVTSACLKLLGVFDQWRLVLEFIAANPYYHATPEFIGIECVSPAKNRVKVYLRISVDYCSLRDAVHFTTLGGRLASPAVQETVDALRALWSLLFPGLKEDTSLQSKRPNPLARGLLVYFEMALDGRKSPIPKFYLPAYRYCDSDEQIARAVTEYYRTSGKGSSKERNYMAHFKQIL